MRNFYRTQQRRQEELELEKELQSMVQESVSQQQQAILSRTPIKLPMASQVVMQQQRQTNPLQQQDQQQQTVKFTMLMRRGKQKTKDIEIPQDSPLLAKHSTTTQQPPQDADFPKLQ
jgi:hypothetical protein